MDTQLTDHEKQSSDVAPNELGIVTLLYCVSVGIFRTPHCDRGDVPFTIRVRKANPGALEGFSLLQLGMTQRNS